MRDELIGTNIEYITASVRQLVKTKGQTMLVEAMQKFEAGIISERVFRVLEKLSDSADKSAALHTASS